MPIGGNGGGSGHVVLFTILLLVYELLFGFT